MSAKKTQVLLIAGALIIFVLLYIAPKTIPQNVELKQNSDASEVDFSNANLDIYLGLALKNIELSQKQVLEKLIEEKKFDSLSAKFDRLKRPDLASYFVEKVAALKDDAENWFKAGNRYYYAVQFSQDKTEIPLLYKCAIRCFNKGLKKDSKNNDAKIMLASCYVEGTSDPMKGITQLKEVEKADSNNVKLQLAFAFFSVKSGQADKAIRRFNKVLEIDSNYIEAYLHLADAYERQNDRIKAIEVLEKYAVKTKDITVQLEINKYIKQLKLNNN